MGRKGRGWKGALFGSPLVYGASKLMDKMGMGRKRRRGRARGCARMKGGMMRTMRMMGRRV